MNRRILELLKLRAHYKLKLVACNDEERTKVLSMLFSIRNELNLYSKEEIQTALNADDIKRKVKSRIQAHHTSEDKEEVSFIFLLVMMLIAFADNKNKSFLMLGLALITLPTSNRKRVRPI